MLSRKTVFRPLFFAAIALTLTACDQRASQEPLASAQRQTAEANNIGRSVAPSPSEPAQPIAAAEPMPSFNVHFTLGSSELSKDAVEVLSSAVDLLRSHPEAHVKLSGYTDAVGSTEANKVLASKRVSSAARFFEQQGIATPRITTVAIGEADPALTPIGANSETWNRRVEIEFTTPPNS